MSPVCWVDNSPLLMMGSYCAAVSVAEKGIPLDNWLMVALCCQHAHRLQLSVFPADQIYRTPEETERHMPEYEVVVIDDSSYERQIGEDWQQLQELKRTGYKVVVRYRDRRLPNHLIVFLALNAPGALE